MTDSRLQVLNFIGGQFLGASSGRVFPKTDPRRASVIAEAPASSAEDVNAAVLAARGPYLPWARESAVTRGDLLFAVCDSIRSERSSIAEFIAMETGRTMRGCRAEVDAAIQAGRFFAAEGQRLYGRTTSSQSPRQSAQTLRCPIGVAGLIVPPNNPFINAVARVFPALICGNTAVLKTSEVTPISGSVLARLFHAAKAPAGLLNVIHGIGTEAGSALVNHPAVGVISFTGSAATGREVAQACARRSCRVSLELGGKNALVVCDDANLKHAVDCAVQSAFGNAGQRCSSTSRVIILDRVYDEFKALFLQATRQLKLGSGGDDDIGPVSSEQQLARLLNTIQASLERGASLLHGGSRSHDPHCRDGYFMIPTILERVNRDSPIAREELFGPVTILFRARNYEEAIEIAQDSDYGLTAAIHTRNVHRAMDFARRLDVGAVTVNGPTFGSEPHMPFGGTKGSGNGSREPGPEALDVYSVIKDIYVDVLADEL